MSLETRPHQDSDTAPVRQLLTDAFRDGGHAADLAEALRARPDAHASIVAVDERSVVGSVHLSVSWIDAPTRLVEVLALSPLAVAPAAQRRGVGRALQAAAIAEAAARARPLVFLEGDPAYYARTGWTPAAAWGLTPPSVRIPRPACQVWPLAGFDPEVMTGALVYNDTFWRHDAVGLRR